MDIERILAEVEQDEAWRMDELRALSNHLTFLDDSSQRERFRRPVLLMLYAHLEGFCQFCFSVYVDAINQEKLLCKDVSFALAAAAMSDVFAALNNTKKKCPEFRNSLPDETALHRHAREREFLQRSTDFYLRPAQFQAEKVVDLESNLKSLVLQKNFFRLGLPHLLLDEYSSSLNKLVGFRNGIAHGRLSKGIDEDTFEELKNLTFEIMNRVKHVIVGALSKEEYLRAKPLEEG